jgi:hypothetical protein
MDPMKLITTFLMTTVLGTAIIKPSTEDAKAPEATVLAADWPTVPSYKPAIAVAEVDAIPTPKPDPVPNEPAKAPTSYRPAPRVNTGCNCEGCLTEADVRRIAAEEYLVQKQVDMQQMRGVRSSGSTGGTMTSSGGSTGGSSGGQSYPVASSGYYTAPPATVAPPAPTPVRSSTAVFTVGTRTYVDSEGCTVRETTYSDGRVVAEKISCPLQQRANARPVRRIFGR